MVDDTARDRAIYHALKAIDEVAAALQAHLLEAQGADPQRAGEGNFDSSTKLLRQARERMSEGLQLVESGPIGHTDPISIRD
jgi:hypothetical protein